MAAIIQRIATLLAQVSAISSDDLIDEATILCHPSAGKALYMRMHSCFLSMTTVEVHARPT
jgi:hypothetical protein